MTKSALNDVALDEEIVQHQICGISHVSLDAAGFPAHEKYIFRCVLFEEYINLTSISEDRLFLPSPTNGLIAQPVQRSENCRPDEGAPACHVYP